MERITAKDGAGAYCAPAGSAQMEGDRLRGIAIDRLGTFEDAVELMERQLVDVVGKLDRLKAQGKVRGAQGQQLLAQKLVLSSTLSLLGVRSDE